MDGRRPRRRPGRKGLARRRDRLTAHLAAPAHHPRGSRKLDDLQARRCTAVGPEDRTDALTPARE